MRIKNLLAGAAATFTLGLIAPSNAEAQGYSYNYTYSYSSGYRPYYGQSHYSYRSYRPEYRDYHHVHGYNHPKYKKGRGRHHKPDISIGPRWDRDHGWVYY